ncbi:MAG: aminoglycoside phosphotransferase family protein [Anaerolineales bacterium]|nr:aminoglycoside phosphotransferase family protein [Anaerolineales bacterium]
MSQPAISKDQIHAIWRAHSLGRIHSIEPIPAGSRNLAYYINSDLVLRVNTLDPQFKKFSNEKSALDQLDLFGLPVPQVIFLDESRRLVPHDLIVLTRLPGASIAESKGSLRPEELNSLAAESGRALAALHQLSFDRFGDFAGLQRNPFSTWREFFLDYAGRYLADARGASLLSPAQSEQLDEILEEAAPLLDEVRQAVFIHSDYHYENILQQNGELSGLLDFEWAYAGDPASDFVPVDERRRVLPGSEKAFIQGYLETRSFDESFSRRVALYRLFLDLEDAVTCRRLGDVRGEAEAIANLDQQLRGWE